MAQFVKTEEVFNPEVDIPLAINILKRQLLKVSKATGHGHLIVLVPAESVMKIARAIDPTFNLYPDPIGDFILWNGVPIVAEESGENGRVAALNELNRFGK